MSVSDGFVAVSSANVYRKPTYHTEIDTQVVLWERVTVQDRDHDFLRIRGEDGYEGWVSAHQIHTGEEPPAGNLKTVTINLAGILDQPDSTGKPVSEAVAGCAVPTLSERGDWTEMKLPDSKSAWIKTAAFRKMPELTRNNLVSFSKNYLGVPYFWGGKTPKGFDCSGFVQLTFKLFGMRLRRDAWMQHEDGTFVSDYHDKAAPGDLMFFAESGRRITHVAIALGESRFIHARGMVRINSLNETDSLFDPTLLKCFVDIKTYL